MRETEAAASRVNQNAWTFYLFAAAEVGLDPSAPPQLSADPATARALGRWAQVQRQLDLVRALRGVTVELRLLRAAIERHPSRGAEPSPERAA